MRRAVSGKPGVMDCAPQFERMLYDNAQLAKLYVKAWQVTEDPEYRRIAEQVLDYIACEMTDSSGGFYSTQDTDSEGEEGKFFLWDLHELEQLLGADSWPVAKYYGVTARGNFEGRNILHVPRDLTDAAAKAEVTPEFMAEALARSRPILFAAREQRVKPARDDKVLAEWNGMMLKAFAYAAGALGRNDYRQIAERNATFLLSQLTTDHRSPITAYRSPITAYQPPSPPALLGTGLPDRLRPPGQV